MGDIAVLAIAWLTIYVISRAARDKNGNVKRSPLAAVATGLVLLGTISYVVTSGGKVHLLGTLVPALSGVLLALIFYVKRKK